MADYFIIAEDEKKGRIEERVNTSECEELRREAGERVRGIQLNQLRHFMKYSTGRDVLGETWSN
ncbi:hypothetical protein HY837_05170 [archaeon]|nr:hypothetical protein [archaeon]